MASFHDLSATTLEGDDFDFNQLKGKRVLIVNTASRCGYTPQYKPLEELHDMYKDQGLVILGFPCNQFGMQEPGSSSDIREFCSRNYGVSFQMMSKVKVKGDDQHPVYAWLTQKPSTALETTKSVGTFTSSWSTAKASWWPRSAAVPIRLETKSRRSQQANDLLSRHLQRSCKKGTPARAFFHGSVLHKRASFLGKLNPLRGAPSSRPF